jgi:predicted aconitase
LDRHGVENHAEELQQKNSEGLDAIAPCGRDVSEAARRQGGGDKVQRDNVLLMEFMFLYPFVSHPRRTVLASGFAKNDLCAAHYMEVAGGRQNKLEKVKGLLHLLQFKNCFRVALLFDDI